MLPLQNSVTFPHLIPEKLFYYLSQLLDFMRYLLVILAFTFCSDLQAQQLYPSLEGDDLLEALVDDYKPLFVLDYGEARDVMYGEIDIQNDTVYCVYSGHGLYLPPNVDPSSFLYMNASTNGINAEHTYPRSKGASEENGNAYSDLHHLFPTRTGVNAARGNLPFGDVVDTQADTWYYKTDVENNIPDSNINAYSERGTGIFEPREDHKGDVARAVFYFYTMYKEDALDADPLFFEAQRETLCEWHYADPVDDKELNRTYMIAGYQDDLANPFILDCSIPLRTYCPNAPVTCEGTFVSVEEVPAEQKLLVFPNPVINTTTIQYPGKSTLMLSDIFGRLLDQQEFQDEIQVDLSSLAKGTYFVEVQGVVKKLIK